MLNRILLVDDSKSARFALRKMLENNGYQVDMAANAQEAFSYLSTQQPDVIFMDHLMPGMDGFEATRMIKNKPETANIPVVMCTSKEDPDYLHQARSNGAFDIIAKPADSLSVDRVLSRLSAGEIGMPADAGSSLSEAYDFSLTGLEPTPEIPSANTQSYSSSSMDDLDDRIVSLLTDALDEVLPERVNGLVETKLPQLRESVMSSFDVVFKPLIDQYVREALARLQAEFSDRIKLEVTKAIEDLAGDVVEKTMSIQMKQINESVQRELHDQLAEVYTNIGDLKANESLRKASPELLEELTNQARDAAIEQANESLFQVSDVARETAAKITDEKLQDQLAQFRVDMNAQLNKTLNSCLESNRQEAEETIWRKVTDMQNGLSGQTSSAKGVAWTALLLALGCASAVAWFQLGNFL